MNMNDPFGRLQGRNEAGYASLRESLTRANVTTAEGARVILARMRRNILTFVGVVLVATLILVLLFPGLAPVTLALALFLVVLGFNSLIQGRRGIERFIVEELSANPAEVTPHD